MKKLFYLFIGFFFVLLAILGIFLPLLPTTPFLILAAMFFSKSSKRWHNWLLNNRIFGPFLSNWESYRCIPYNAKLLALGMIVSFGTLSIVMIGPLWLQVTTFSLISYACYFIISIKSCQPNVSTESETGDIS